MDQRHKQRIVGAVVLVALAVIFLPLLLRGPVEHDSLHVPMQIPPRPEAPVTEQRATRPESRPAPALDPLPVRDPEASLGQDAATVLEQAPDTRLPATPPEPIAEPETVPEPPPVVTESTPEPERVTTPEVKGYAVQVGSFSSRDNAMGLRNRLLDQGFSAFVDESTAGGKPIFRLRVGPVVEREEAQELARRLRQAADLEALVISHP